MNKFLATAATLLALATPAFADDDCEVNLDQYDKLKIGMSLKEVVNILGCDGNMTFSSKAASYKVESWSWNGIYLTVTNGSLASKAHGTLRRAGEAKPVEKPVEPIVINIDINVDTGEVTKTVKPAAKANPAAVGQKAIDAMPK